MREACVGELRLAADLVVQEELILRYRAATIVLGFNPLKSKPARVLFCYNRNADSAGSCACCEAGFI